MFDRPSTKETTGCLPGLDGLDLRVGQLGLDEMAVYEIQKKACVKRQLAASGLMTEWLLCRSACSRRGVCLNEKSPRPSHARHR